MLIKNAEFITSAATRGGFVLPQKPLIAVSGKSNVGKSSFINMLANRKKLAKTSNTPGRTRLINYFDFGEFVLADLPGYGFAQAPKTEKAKWAKLMAEFFQMENYVCHVFSLIDIRHKPTADDVEMINYLHHYAIPFTLIATKADKLSKQAVKTQIKMLANYLAITTSDIIAVSNETRQGKDDVLNALDQILSVAKEEPYLDEDDEELDEEVAQIEEEIEEQ